MDACLLRFRSFLLSSSSLVSRLSELSGRRRVCHCAPSARCHRDILINEFAKRLLDDRPAECSILIGVFAEPDDFVAAAAALRHPFEVVVVPDPMCDGILGRLSRAAAETADKRSKALTFWFNRRKALEQREKELHQQMHPDVVGVMAGNALLVFRELLDALDFAWRDVLLHHMAAGFPIVWGLSGDRRATTSRKDRDQEP